MADQWTDGQSRSSPDGRDGERSAVVVASGASDERPDDDHPEAVGHPSRVIRLAVMAQSLLSQIADIDLDGAARHRLAAVLNHSVTAIRELLSEDLQHEIDTLELRLPDDPTDAEVRVAQAQLVGWLEGLMHGIRTTVIAHQIATQEELARAYQQGLEAAHQQTDERGSSPYL